jgi:hypothetical protein
VSDNRSRLYIWLGRTPGAFDPDLEIDDVPGTADLDLLIAAIMDGKLGTVLPAKIFMSTHQSPEHSRSIRTVDIGKLLRDIGLDHQRCYQISLPDND